MYSTILPHPRHTTGTNYCTERKKYAYSQSRQLQAIGIMIEILNKNWYRYVLVLLIVTMVCEILGEMVSEGKSLQAEPMETNLDTEGECGLLRLASFKYTFLSWLDFNLI